MTRVFCEAGPITRPGHAVEETGACTLRFESGAVGTFVFSDAVAAACSFEQATGENPSIPQTVSSDASAGGGLQLIPPSQGEPIYTFLGTAGSMSFPSLQVFHYPNPSGCWTDTFEKDEAPALDPTPPFVLQLRHFAAVCRGDEEPACSAAEAVRAIETLEAIKESIRTGLPVDVPQ